MPLGHFSLALSGEVSRFSKAKLGQPNQENLGNTSHYSLSRRNQSMHIDPHHISQIVLVNLPDGKGIYN